MDGRVCYIGPKFYANLSNIFFLKFFFFVSFQRCRLPKLHNLALATFSVKLIITEYVQPAPNSLQQIGYFRHPVVFFPLNDKTD